MREVLSVAAQWARDQRAFAVATVAGIRGSSPRELGASMLIAGDGAVYGNVSGGCVEGAVIEAGLEALETGRATVEHYGISDDAVFGVGLMCGGQIDVLVRPVPAGSDQARQLIALAERADEPVTLALDVAGAQLGAAEIREDAGGAAETRLWHEDANGCPVEAEAASRSVLLLAFGQAPRLIIVGAVEYAVALSRLGAAAGMRVSVVDPRSAFAVPERFPDAEVVVAWPDRYLAGAALDARAAVCVLSHDPKIDEPALRVALAGPAEYVGAMGSRRAHADRLERLAEAGVSAAQMARLRSPIGLDLGGRSPEETALSILAEIVAVRHGAGGGPLSERDGPVHAEGVVGVRAADAGR